MAPRKSISHEQRAILKRRIYGVYCDKLFTFLDDWEYQDGVPASLKHFKSTDLVDTFESLSDEEQSVYLKIDADKTYKEIIQGKELYETYKVDSDFTTWESYWFREYVEDSEYYGTIDYMKKAIQFIEDHMDIPT